MLCLPPLTQKPPRLAKKSVDVGSFLQVMMSLCTFFSFHCMIGHVMAEQQFYIVLLSELQATNQHNMLDSHFPTSVFVQVNQVSSLLISDQRSTPFCFQNFLNPSYLSIGSTQQGENCSCVGKFQQFPKDSQHKQLRQL